MEAPFMKTTPHERRHDVPRRQDNLRTALKSGHLAAILLSRPEDVAYLTGYTGEDALALFTARQSWLLTDPRYREEADATVCGLDVVMWKTDPFTHAASLLRKTRVLSVGVCTRHLTMEAHARLKTGLRPHTRIETADAIPETLRLRKSGMELRAIRAAIRCAEAAMEAVRPRIRAGMTEADLRLDLEWEMRRRGASGPAFETIVAADANASRPHAHAGTRRLRAGGRVLIDWGACVNGYNSDLTRVFYLGSMSAFWRDGHETVLRARHAALQAIRAGATCADPDTAARAVFEEAGCLDRFAHSLGHGVGRAVHEAPRLSRVGKGLPLPIGAVVTVEPGLYYPGRGGIRIEDMVHVTETGHRILSRYPRDVESLILA